ncbi:MAG: phage holin family protein [Candidatus Eremiobacteraeota bacterium]|nr:phage holin family protein [Candidatus Eremiobacteraeota bacterium]
MNHHFEDDSLRERPMGELMKKLGEDLSLLVRQELDLAKAEIIEKTKSAGAGAGMFSGAAVAGVLALGALTAFFILALSLVIAPWLAALVITVLYGSGAAILAMNGKKKFLQAAPPVPEQTAQTLKEDVQWAKTRIKSAGR